MASKTTTKAAKKSPRAKAPRAPAAKKSPARRTRASTPAATPELPLEAPPPEVAESHPERAFSARVAPPVPLPPLPNRRRAVFIDVENTSKASRVQDVLSQLAIDRSGARVDLVASGNWRVIGAETARLLASAGAQLVHSAPKTGVRDWSDLRIAVAAGVWLASGRPGDLLEIVSDDNAFDAVGDVAASLGITFVRVSGRRGSSASSRAETSASAASSSSSSSSSAASSANRRRRGGRGRSRTRGGRSTTTAVAAPAEAEAIPVEAETDVETVFAENTDSESAAPASAPTEDLLGILREFLARHPNGVSLDALAARLKALGFTRPPGSPRLVTRVRALREFAVSPRGFITPKAAAS